MTRDEKLAQHDRIVKSLDVQIGELTSHLAEINLRVFFVMRLLKLKVHTNGLVGADGQAMGEDMTAYEAYTSGGREKLMIELEAEMQAVAAELEAKADGQIAQVAAAAKEYADLHPDADVKGLRLIHG